MMLKQWYDTYTLKLVQTLAVASGINPHYLGHVVAGRRNMRAETAAKVERGSQAMQRIHGTPVLDRAELCEVCRQCPHARRA